jgi:hypothetical protein
MADLSGNTTAALVNGLAGIDLYTALRTTRDGSA